MDEKELPKNFIKHAPLVLATRQVIGPERLPVCFAFREPPNNEADTGWIFWSGQEDQAYIDDSSNTVVCPLSSFLELDPSLRTLMQFPVGTAWERDSPTDEWQEVIGYFDD